MLEIISWGILDLRFVELLGFRILLLVAHEAGSHSRVDCILLHLIHDHLLSLSVGNIRITLFDWGVITILR